MSYRRIHLEPEDGEIDEKVSKKSERRRSSNGSSSYSSSSSNHRKRPLPQGFHKDERRSQRPRHHHDQQQQQYYHDHGRSQRHSSSSSRPVPQDHRRHQDQLPFEHRFHSHHQLHRHYERQHDKRQTTKNNNDRNDGNKKKESRRSDLHQHSTMISHERDPQYNGPHSQRGHPANFSNQQQRRPSCSSSNNGNKNASSSSHKKSRTEPRRHSGSQSSNSKNEPASSHSRISKPDPHSSNRPQHQNDARQSPPNQAHSIKDVHIVPDQSSVATSTSSLSTTDSLKMQQHQKHHHRDKRKDLPRQKIQPSQQQQVPALVSLKNRWVPRRPKDESLERKKNLMLPPKTAPYIPPPKTVIPSIVSESPHSSMGTDDILSPVTDKKDDIPTCNATHCKPNPSSTVTVVSSRSSEINAVTDIQSEKSRQPKKAPKEKIVTASLEKPIGARKEPKPLTKSIVKKKKKREARDMSTDSTRNIKPKLSKNANGSTEKKSMAVNEKKLIVNNVKLPQTKTVEDRERIKAMLKKHKQRKERTEAAVKTTEVKKAATVAASVTKTVKRKKIKGERKPKTEDVTRKVAIPKVESLRQVPKIKKSKPPKLKSVDDPRPVEELSKRTKSMKTDRGIEKQRQLPKPPRFDAKKKASRIDNVPIQSPVRRLILPSIDPSSSSDSESETDDEEVMRWAHKMFGVPLAPVVTSPPARESAMSEAESSDGSSSDSETDDEEVMRWAHKMLGVPLAPPMASLPVPVSASSEAQSSGDSSSDSETDDEEVTRWAHKMFGIPLPPPMPALPARESVSSETEISDDSSSDSETDEEEVMRWGHKMFGITAPAPVVPMQEDSDDEKSDSDEEFEFEESVPVDADPARVFHSVPLTTEQVMEELLKRRQEKRLRIQAEARLRKEEEQRMKEAEEIRRKRAEAVPLTLEQVKAIEDNDRFSKGKSSAHWVRRSRRQPLKSVLNSDKLKYLLEKLRGNDTDMEVLKMKKYVNDPDAPQAVINAALDALEENTNCQALYIQNFNRGMQDAQVLHLLRVLQLPSCNIWCLNIGETYNVKMKTWKKFAKGLRKTKITHMYASEHTITPRLKERIRDTIRENRKKHDMHISPNNLDIIIQCTHCWWNPINAKSLRPFVRSKGYEHILRDKEVQGLRGSTSKPHNHAADT